MHKILLVDDSTDSRNLVQRALGNSLHFEWAKDLKEAKEVLEKHQFDLILLDIMLPDGDGYQLCSILQTSSQFKNIPVIFLTGKTSVTDKVLGLSVGADDYITKPFEPLELKARVDARLRKKDRDKTESDIVKYGDVEINRNTQKVHIYDQGQSKNVDLTPIEFKLLLFLSKELNKVYGREEILSAIWGNDIHVYNRSVDTHISKLRKKLGPKANYIESVHGSGYRFTIEKDNA